LIRHWHFDHTDNNAALHAAGYRAGARKYQEANGEAHDLRYLACTLSLHRQSLAAGDFRVQRAAEDQGESLALQRFAPAHTDTTSTFFLKRATSSNGRPFFNGFYPYIDSSTEEDGGMIAAADKILGLASANTKIVPGMVRLGNKEDLTKFRAMLVTARIGCRN